MNLSDGLIASVKRHEGWRSDAYQDSEGIWTIGYGTNLQVLKIDEVLGERWLMDKLLHYAELIDKQAVTESLTTARRDVLIEMAYNLGMTGLLKFKKMWAALELEDYVSAGHHMMDSKWARQVGKRAERLRDKMVEG